VTPDCRLDHIVVTAHSLPAGVAWVEAALDVPLQQGGEHVKMGTHNALLRLGASTYLEVIAPNPAAKPPGRPRWFGLDDLTSESTTRLATWVARTADIRAAAAACSEPLGDIEAMRRGTLEWLIAIPAGGSLVPALIQWRTEGHPAQSLEDRGCSLVRLEAFDAEPERLERTLVSLGLDGQVAVHGLPARRGPHLVAHIETPSGSRTLSGA
jgi:hypothetical protein